MHKLHLPRLGQTMEAGTVRAWLKEVGERYEIGEPLYELETDKVTTEVEATLPGTLARIVTAASEEDERPIGTLLAVVADPGEQLTEELIAQAIAEEPAIEAEAQSPLVAPAQAPVAPQQRGQRVRAMPKARRLAEELGVDLSTVDGSGPDGTIVVDDVERAAAGGIRVRERRPVRGVARSMADTMTRSWQVPQFVQTALVDASALRERRRAESDAVHRGHGVRLSYNDLLAEAVVRAVGRVPLANSSFGGDSITVYEDVNLSMAVATDAGLVVPVIHRAQELGLSELAVRIREVAARAHQRSLTPADVEGGTVTISNLGMQGVETGAPIVLAPQAVIVFTGTIIERPAVVDGELAVRPSLYVSVAFDHRVFDGAAAAGFTTTLSSIIAGT